MSPEPLPKEEMMESEEEAGSFYPQLLHGDETEGAFDPEEDRAALVTSFAACRQLSAKWVRVCI